jgi:hypothetical protein
MKSASPVCPRPRTTELKIELAAKAGKRVEAMVRRKQGAMYDFEFIVITPQIARLNE